MTAAEIRLSLDDIYMALAELDRIKGYDGERENIRRRIVWIRDRLLFAATEAKDQK